jgi:hypothetical protein
MMSTTTDGAVTVGVRSTGCERTFAAIRCAINALSFVDGHVILLRRKESGRTVFHSDGPTAAVMHASTAPT